MKKNFLLLGLTILIGGFVSLSINAQKNNNTEKAQKMNVASEGIGVQGVTVGKSTKNDVEKKWGKNYKWTVNKKYSYQMTYPNGVSFYFCQKEKVPQVFDIEMRSPYEVKTAKGVKLRQSTIDDVKKIYGKPITGLQYRGIEFYYDTVGGKKLVTTIDVVENKGLRQCVVEKEKPVKITKPKTKPAKN